MTSPIDADYHRYDQRPCSPLAGLCGITSLPIIPRDDSASAPPTTATRALPTIQDRPRQDGVTNSLHLTLPPPSLITAHPHPDADPLPRQRGAAEIPAAPRVRPRELPILEETQTQVWTAHGTPTTNDASMTPRETPVAPMLGIYDYVPPPPASSGGRHPAHATGQRMLPHALPNGIVQYTVVGSPISGDDTTPSTTNADCIPNAVNDGR